MYRTLYYVMLEGSEALVAICDNRATAEWIVEHYPAPCIMRYIIGK